MLFQITYIVYKWARPKNVKSIFLIQLNAYFCWIEMEASYYFNLIESGELMVQEGKLIVLFLADA